MNTPSVSADLAEKVLAAELRNTIKTVGEGGTLPAPHRKMMQEITITPELALEKRAASLLSKFCAGQDLTPAQWEEVRAVHPNFAQLPPPSVTEPENPVHESGRKLKLSKEDSARYERIYKVKWRQIRRWIDRGIENNDPCPLGNPALMPIWWNRHTKYRIPPGIEEAALEAAKNPTSKQTFPDPEKPIPSSGQPESQVQDRTSLPASTLPSAQPGKIVDLENFDPEEGDRLRELKQIQAAKFADYKDRLKLGEDCSVIEGKYFKLCETIDKMEARAIIRLEKLGKVILVEVVERELAAGAELLRQSTESRVRRVLELCPSLNAEQRVEVTAAIQRAALSDIKMLTKLPSLSSNDVLHELAA